MHEFITHDVTQHIQSMQDTLHTMSHQSYMLAKHNQVFMMSQTYNHHIHCIKTQASYDVTIQARNMLV